MTRLFLLFCALVVFCLSNIANAQKIEFSELEFDFGEVRQGEKLIHDFNFLNSGTNDLIIRKLNPACGCIAAVAESGTILPGKKSSIRVTFDTTGFQGNKTKTIRLYSSDESNSSIVLAVSANIVPEVSISPGKVELNEVMLGRGAELLLDLKRSAGVSAKITGVVSKSPLIEAVLKNNGEAVGVKVLPSVPEGISRSQLILKTDSQVVPVINVPVFIKVLGPLLITPEGINFGLVSNLSSLSALKTVRIEKRDGSDLSEVDDIEVDGSNAKVDIDPSSNLKQLVLSVRLVAGPKTVVRSRFTVKFKNDDRKYEIPFFGVTDEL